VLLIPIGLMSITFINSCSTTVQLSTPPEMRGRIIALWVVVFQGSTPIGGPIVGWIGGELGARWSVLVGGLSALIAAAIAGYVLLRRPAVAASFDREMNAQAARAAALEAAGSPTAAAEAAETVEASVETVVGDGPPTWVVSAARSGSARPSGTP
jgi:MFS family permease